LLLVASEVVNVTAISNSSLNVTIQPPVNTANISHYNVTLNDAIIFPLCKIEVGKELLGCKLEGLFAATKYVVKACSWMQIGQLCSESVGAIGWTKPNAPKTVTVTSISSTSIKVDVVAPDDATNIDQFNIILKDTHPTRFCGIEADEYPLECTISGLLEETNYTVEACSWMRSGQICSDFVEATGCTKPKAPKGATVTALSTSSVKVTVIPPNNTTNIDQYNITVRGAYLVRFCEVDANNEPLECSLGSLSIGTQYSVGVCSWLKSSQICSEPVKAIGWTKPQAPGKITVSPGSSSSLDVAVETPTDATGIGRYEVSTVGVTPPSLCTIRPGGNLWCRLEGLQAATKYEVIASGCINGSYPVVCSHNVVASGWTKAYPPRGAAVIPVTTTSGNVVILPPNDTTNIDQYNITVDNPNSSRICEIEAKTDLLECPVGGLSAGTKIMVKACSWMTSVHICSDFLQAVGWTKPNAPKGMIATPLSTTSFKLAVVPPDDAKHIDQYNITIKDASSAMVCEIAA
uniref:Fibronectin type-III domain-containing protein n=1 Tax=Mesocestoides corti TaxID=53468 RepID=A0A5K3FU62_MESCO